MKSSAALAVIALVVMVPFAMALPTNQPLPPSGLTVEPSEAGNHLAWSPPAVETDAPVIGYRVYRFDDGEKQSVAQLDATLTAFLDADLQANHTYVYYVTAVSASGESMPSNFASNYPPCTEIVYLGPPPWVDVNCITPSGLVIHLLEP